MTNGTGKPWGVIRTPKGDTLPENELMELVMKYDPAQRVLDAIPDDEIGEMKSATANDVRGYSLKSLIFQWLCIAARLRSGSEPLDIVRDIEKAKSARGILI
jgi:hypothetical protein